jgi:hypothetical protein
VFGLRRIRDDGSDLAFDQANRCALQLSRQVPRLMHNFYFLDMHCLSGILFNGNKLGLMVLCDGYLLYVDIVVSRRTVTAF